MSVSVTLADVQREAIQLEFRMQVEEDWFDLDKPGTGENGMFRNTAQGVQMAYDWLQRKRVDMARFDKAVSSEQGRAWGSRFHRHRWERHAESTWLFTCSDHRCLHFAICPGCLGDGHLALRVIGSLWGIAVYWCPVHEGQQSRFLGER